MQVACPVLFYPFDLSYPGILGKPARLKSHQGAVVASIKNILFLSLLQTLFVYACKSDILPLYS
jgi:hypothetical protein